MNFEYYAKRQLESYASSKLKEDYIKLVESSIDFVKDKYKCGFKNCITFIKKAEDYSEPLSENYIDTIKTNYSIMTNIKTMFDWCELVIKAMAKGNQRELLLVAHNNVYQDVLKFIS